MFILLIELPLLPFNCQHRQLHFGMQCSILFLTIIHRYIKLLGKPTKDCSGFWYLCTLDCLTGDLRYMFSASLLADPLLQYLWSSQTHLLGNFERRFLCGSPNSPLNSWWCSPKLCVITVVRNYKTRRRDQVWVSRWDLGLQKQQLHPVQPKRHRLRDCSRGNIYSFLCQLIRHVYPLLLQSLSMWFPLRTPGWTERTLYLADFLFLGDCITS